MADRFDICLDEVLRHEGGYADHPQDPGGATSMGITHKTLARWRQVSPWWDLPKSAVKDLTRAEAGKIYRAGYWDRCKADHLPPGLDLALFDYAVNSGPDGAIKALQAILGVLADGQIGPLTLAAVARRSSPGLVTALCDQRLGFLQRLGTFATFGRGWTSRVASVRKAALAVAGAENIKPIQIPERKTMMDILNGYKTYIVSIFMLLAGVLQMLGVDLPSLDGSSAGQLVMDALAVLFLRRGLKADIGAA
ncbi:MAG: glycoside hydrolase family 108 protein [Candidatus Devosia phytovorans]|uniref:Glycoside hydrolase family 108 protein n=1 Tax=Candidatus Devosia phytovorans TaxID=3121372 RepID=A0AAJ5VRF4_9HYPH|nr:glycoside hydrolase family 108 protein [Devosia sp.]WEK02770.1 MAG: glycoside hydrolase family 108 protein [Devosia sp.]